MISLAEANKVGGHKLSQKSLVIHGDAFASGVRQLIDKLVAHGEYARFKLIICDPPYGNINKNKEWDDVAEYNRWFAHCVDRAQKYATICMWGGVGKPGNRPFLEWCSRVEKDFTEWEGSMITWGKRRGYGLSDDYLFTREECFILYRGPRGKTGNPVFNIPLLSTLRGYDGYSEKYPAKSKYLRRTNVWSDIGELLRGKIHPTQKPDKLYEILVSTHSNEGDIVYDPCAGSGTTARACKTLNRTYCIVEKHRPYLEEAKLM